MNKIDNPLARLRNRENSNIRDERIDIRIDNTNKKNHNKLQ